MSEGKSELQHDEFARKVFSKRKNLIDFIKNALPKEYIAKIDLDSISLSKDSFIGEKYVTKKLGNFYSDMIIDMKMNGKEAKCAVLIEHKSEYDKFTIAQMLKYLSLIWHEEILNEAKELTPTIPVLLYHGRSKWKRENNMEMCFNRKLDEEFKRFIPKVKYILFDLNKIDDEELKGNIEYIIAMRMLKHIFIDIFSELKIIMCFIEDYVSTHGIDSSLIDFLDALINYIAKSEHIEPENIDELVDTITNNELKEVIMTLEKKLELRAEERGKEEGLKIGEQKGRIETAKKMIEKGLDIDFITEITGLSKEDIENLKS